MSDETKLMLSGDELALAEDRGIILTKRAVTEKAALLFSSLVPAVDYAFAPVIAGIENFPAVAPRIFKGENYRGFPYVIMDHPAAFQKEHVLALRTMFWWGHFISITLHISGSYKVMFADKISRKLHAAPFFIAAGEKEWEHHFDNDNFRPASSFTKKETENIFERPFLKIALKYDLKDWNRMPELLPRGYALIGELVK